MARKAQWVFAPDKRKQPKPKVGADIKKSVTERADSVALPTLREQHIKPPPTDNDFNYIEAIDTKWYRHYFYFFSTYRVPGPNAIAPTFESKFARMEYVAEDEYNLAFMRYTGEWVVIDNGLSADKCFEAILTDAWFHP